MSVCALLMLISWLSLGCISLGTMGPRVETRYVIVHPGYPGRVVENTKALVAPLRVAGDPARQDIGGWVVMPEEHWDALMRAIEKKGDCE
ncbi:hypothetical protein HS125_04520 [bacterium]|nr:hypothetical protein [bacterium]